MVEKDWDQRNCDRTKSEFAELIHYRHRTSNCISLKQVQKCRLWFVLLTLIMQNFHKRSNHILFCHQQKNKSSKYQNHKDSTMNISLNIIDHTLEKCFILVSQYSKTPTKKHNSEHRVQTSQSMTLVM